MAVTSPSFAPTAALLVGLVGGGSLACRTPDVGWKPPPSADAPVPPTDRAEAWVRGQHPSAPAQPLWQGLAAYFDLRPDDALRYWQDSLRSSDVERALVAAELLSAQSQPLAVPTDAPPRLRARLALASGATTAVEGWLPDFRVTDGVHSWPAPATPHRADLAGGMRTAVLEAKACWRVDGSTGTVIVWTDAEGSVTLDGQTVWKRGPRDPPYREFSVRWRGPGHRLTARLQRSDGHPRLGVFVAPPPQPSSRCSEGGETTVTRWPPVVAPGGPWARRLIDALRAGGGFGWSPPEREAVLGWVPDRASRSPWLVSAWAAWVASIAPAPAVLEQMQRLPADHTPARLWLLRAELESEVGNRAERTLREALARHDRPALRAALARLNDEDVPPTAPSPPEHPRSLDAARRRVRRQLVEAGPAAGLAAAQELTAIAPHDVRSFRLLLEAAEAAQSPEAGRTARRALRRLGAADVWTEIRWPDAALPVPPDWDPTPWLGSRAADEWGSGHGRVTLLARRIERRHAEGGALVLQQRVERLQTQGTIEAQGQLRPPPDGVLVRARTWKPDGRWILADAHLGVEDLSFVELQPFDGVEVAWLTVDREDVRRHSFASDVPIRRSEWVVEVPAGASLEYRSLNGAPPPDRRKTADGERWSWTMDDVSPWPDEPFAPAPDEYQPSVTVWSPGARERALRANATVPDPAHPWIRELGRSLAAGIDDPFRRASRLYAEVVERIRPGVATHPVATWLSRRGDRTRLMLELLRGAGIRVTPVLARAGTMPRRPASLPDPHRFVLPLLRIDGNDGEHSWIGFDGNASWLGRLPPAFRGGSYVETGSSPTARPVVRVIGDADIDPTPLRTTVELQLHRSGSATGTVTVALDAAWRGRVEENLRTRARTEVEQQLEQALSSLMGPTDVVGWQLGPPLTVQVRVSVGDGALTVPDTPPMTVLLGVPGPKDYLVPAVRRSPLLIEERHERLELRIRSPGGRCLTAPTTFRRRSAFGRYAQSFFAEGDTTTLVREWSFPQLRLQPDDFLPFRAVMEQVRSDTRTELRFGEGSAPGPGPF
jgi:hypothetical protein